MSDMTGRLFMLLFQAKVRRGEGISVLCLGKIRATQFTLPGPEAPREEDEKELEQRVGNRIMDKKRKLKHRHRHSELNASIEQDGLHSIMR